MNNKLSIIIPFASEYPAVLFTDSSTVMRYLELTAPLSPLKILSLSSENQNTPCADNFLLNFFIGT